MARSACVRARARVVALRSRGFALCARHALRARAQQPGGSSTAARTSRGNARMMVSVVMSSATRVPCVSLLLSSLVRQPTT
jgi:hypothetical protein